MLALDRKSFQIDVNIRVEPDFDFLSAEYRAFFNLQRATAFQAPLWLDSDSSPVDAVSLGTTAHHNDPGSR